MTKKITKQQLEQLIAEEIQDSLNEFDIRGALGGVRDFFRGSKVKPKKPGEEPEQSPPVASAEKPATDQKQDGEQEVVPDQVVSQQDATALSAAQNKVKMATADIVLPHAMLLSRQMMKLVGPSLQKVLAGLSQQQRGAAMQPVINYLKMMPKMSNPVIAEALTPAQQELKAKLASKHAGNPALISKNLLALRQDLLNKIKASVNLDNIGNLLLYSMPKQQQNSKEGLQYMKSLQQKPQAHLAVFLQNAEIVINNIMTLIDAAMPEQQKPEPKPLPEQDSVMNEGLGRWKKLANIKD